MLKQAAYLDERTPETYFFLQLNPSRRRQQQQ
jgi:hypothetical protein